MYCSKKASSFPYHLVVGTVQLYISSIIGKQNFLYKQNFFYEYQDVQIMDGWMGIVEARKVNHPRLIYNCGL